MGAVAAGSLGLVIAAPGADADPTAGWQMALIGFLGPGRGDAAGAISPAARRQIEIESRTIFSTIGTVVQSPSGIPVSS